MNLRLLSIYTLSTAALLAGCTGNDEPGGATGNPIVCGLSAAQQPYGGGTRGDDDEETPGSTDLPSEIPADIGVWALAEGVQDVVLDNRQMYYFRNPDCPITLWGHKNAYKDEDAADPLLTLTEQNLWPYADPASWRNTETAYRFFAYAPWTAEPDMAFVGDKKTYAWMLSGLIWRHIPHLSNTDYMVADRLVEYLSMPGDDRTQMFRMQHLMARVALRFKLGPKFSELRSIYLKRLEIYDAVGTRYQVNVDFTRPDDDGLRRTRLTWATEAVSVPCTFVLLNNEPDPLTGRRIDGIWLNHEEAQLLASLYVAMTDTDLPTLTIRSTYDVYDLVDNDGDGVKEHWQLLRSNETSENTININATTDALTAGQYFNVTITVEPKFLYVLSDNDEDPRDAYDRGLTFIY